jgi:UDPglucose 6-dehydrogenase
MRISVVGTGYVGLVTGTCLANLGHRVTCIDSNREKIELLSRGIVPIFEPGLAELIESNAGAGRLTFSAKLTSAQHADAVFIAVGTPPRHRAGYADLSQVKNVARELGRLVQSNVVLVLKSTVPIGTAEEVERIVSEERGELDFDVASNPEFLRAGSAVHDFMHPDRIVIGAEHDATRERLAAIYRALACNGTPLVFTSRRSAELIKYSANALLATKIAFINEVADLCESVGAHVGEVSRGVGLDHRIGPDFLAPGPGFGGSCFPKDILALLTIAEEHRVAMRVAESVLAANEVRKRSLARRIADACGGSLRGKSVGLLGLTFKANTDDMRESPSIALVTGLVDMGSIVRAYEPVGVEQAKKVLTEEITYCSSAYEAAQGADVLVVVTEWQEFRGLDFGRVRKAMRCPLIVDLRNMYRQQEIVGRGFHYVGVGLPRLPALGKLEPPKPAVRFHGRGNGAIGTNGRGPLRRKGQADRESAVSGASHEIDRSNGRAKAFGTSEI